MGGRGGGCKKTLHFILVYVYYLLNMSLEFNTFSRGLDSPMIFFILYYMMDVCSSLPNNQTYYKLIKEEKTHFQGQVSFILFELYFSIFGFVSLDLKEKSRTELFQNISNI